MFNFLPPPLNSILPFVIVLGVLVFFHELGHYLAARWRGVHVEAFSIGFGRSIARWTDRRGTVWKLSWLPLGGYVKLHGQERPQDAPSDVVAAWQPGRTFHEKQVASRAIIIAAGPIANFLLAAVLFAGLYGVMGKPVTMAVVNDVVADSAASRAGLKPGDRITAIGTEPVNEFQDLQRIISNSAGTDLTLHVVRDGLERTVAVTPERGECKAGKLGVSARTTDIARLDPVTAVATGVGHTWTVARQTLGGLWLMVTGQRCTDDLGGPLRIAQLSGQVAKDGVSSLIEFIAILSVNLGLINLFPIPVLDGGHLLFFLAEALRGRPLPPRAQEYGFRAGLAVIGALFVFATWNDLARLGLGRWVAHLIG